MTFSVNIDYALYWLVTTKIKKKKVRLLSFCDLYQSTTSTCFV